MKKKIIFCGGGTGGHVFPSVTLSNYFAKKKYETILLIDKRGIKYLSSDFLIYKKLDVAPYHQGILNKIFFYLKLTKAFFKSFSLLRKERPNIVFGFGGYIIFPICLAAKLLNIKIVLYESNNVLGKSNKFFVRFCEKLFTNSENVINLPKKYSTKCIKVGNVLREEIIKYKLHKKDYSNQTKKIIILGGSQGAEIFGSIIPHVILDLTRKYKINVIQQVIPKHVNEIRNIYDKNKIENYVFSFHQNILKLISKADFAISRCGASTLGELHFLGVPFVAIPYPFATDNHQYQNAVYYENMGCCWILNQKKLTSHSLKEMLIKILDNNIELNLKRKNMLNNYSGNNFMKIEKAIEKLI